MLTCSLCVYAHPGSTDEEGGHVDWSTGEYHYHHGYPAHQHTNGICPYNWKDNTDTTYHGNTSTIKYNYTYGDRDKYVPTPHPTPNLTYSQTKDKTSFSTYIFCFCTCIIIICILWFKQQQSEQEYQKSLILEKESKNNKTDFVAPSDEDLVRQLANVPKDIIFDEYDIPHKYKIVAGGQEDLYKVKIAKNNPQIYHKPSCEYGSMLVNYTLALKKGLRPCKLCRPVHDDISWYYKYLEIKNNNKFKQDKL